MKSNAKRLRSLTIVPDSLYVKRDADRQLDRTIEEMGRPAYVLVARQMGKTNLLLHMKRSREACGDVACYFDLSTRYATLQALFRAIIDACSDALNTDKAKQKVEADRKLGMEPNVEFDLHLRLLLTTARPSRLIIILDEIDSLIGAPYSDKVLAQIRSMYFARENHPIYEHLTYVLSGVAEPADLIKDRNISPFNIGEKIYLDNFSLAELRALLLQADLNLPPRLIERVYHWTRGNPRMSWDICANLEDIMSAGERLDPSHVDMAVDRIYLRHFDRAPVDHVRTLVRSDPNMRDALMSMHYGKSSTLDDTMRSRLYLAGITNFVGASPEFNNPIIAQALSTDWLNQLTTGHASLLDSATRQYNDHDYSSSVRLFEKYLEDDGTDHDGLDQARLMQFGIALYHVQRFPEAKHRLTEARASRASTELQAPILFYLASAMLQMGDADGSIALFEEVSGLPGEFHYLAKLALAGALVTASASTHATRIIKLAREISARDGARADDKASEITASAHYNEAVAHLASNNKDKAIYALELALDSAPSDLIPSIYLKLIDVVEDQSRKDRALLDVVQLLERNLPMARRHGATALSFSNFTLGALAAKALQLNVGDVAPRLISLAKKSLGEPSIGRIAVRILKSAVEEIDHTALRSLYEAGLASSDNDGLAAVDTLTLAKAATIAADSSNKRVAFDRYVNLVRLHRESFTFEEIDGLICIGQISSGINARNHARARATIAFFDEIKQMFLTAQPFLYAFYLNQKITYYNVSKETSESQKIASELLRLTEDKNLANTDLLDPAFESFLLQIKANARETLALAESDRLRRFGRNQMVRYVDTRTGQTKMAKFKKVQDDLRSGLFELLAPTQSDDI